MDTPKTPIIRMCVKPLIQIHTLVCIPGIKGFVPNTPIVHHQQHRRRHFIPYNSNTHCSSRPTVMSNTHCSSGTGGPSFASCNGIFISSSLAAAQHLPSSKITLFLIPECAQPALCLNREESHVSIRQIIVRRASTRRAPAIASWPRARLRLTPTREKEEQKPDSATGGCQQKHCSHGRRTQRPRASAAMPRCAATAPRRCRSHSCALDARPPPTVPRTARCTQHTEHGAALQ